MASLRQAWSQLAVGILVAGGLTATSHTRPLKLSGPLEGMSSGDMNGDGVLEIAALVRAGSGSNGTVVLLGSDRTMQWTHEASTPLVGFPAMGDYDGDGRDELAYCEMSPVGYCHVLDANGDTISSVGPFYYPGFSGGGPTATDVDGDGKDELLIASWGGIVASVDGSSGAVHWSFDAYAGHGELIHGQLAVGDLDGDGQLEAVFGGASSGSIFVLDAGTGEPRTVIPAAASGVFVGNAPALIDLQGEGRLQIVAALSGDEPSLHAFDLADGLLWSRSFASANFDFQSPLGADIDNDSLVEIVLQSVDGQLYVLDRDGNIEGERWIGRSWVPPILCDLTGDEVPEIVAVSSEKGYLIALEGSELQELGKFARGSRGTYPSPLADDFDGDGSVELVTGSWHKQRIAWDSTNAPAGGRWTDLGGNRSHTGTPP